MNIRLVRIMPLMKMVKLFSWWMKTKRRIMPEKAFGAGGEADMNEGSIGVELVNMSLGRNREVILPLKLQP